MRFLVSWLLLFAGACCCPIAESQWETVEAVGQPTARHEATLVAFEDQIYLIGGRRINPVDMFDPMTRTWTAKSETPMELHHFQAIVVDDAIHLMGAMTGKWPNEKPLDRVIVYYPKKDEFRFTHTIPESRRRGGAGAVYYDDKIYLVGGITNGHMDGYVPWLDQYDPKTGDWKVLPDAPHARDHFQAVVRDSRLYALAGRTTSHATGQGMDLTVPEVDVYDLGSKSWVSGHGVADLPTPRAGNMAFVWGDQIVVGGGESMTQKAAHDQVEVLNVHEGTWATWPSLNRGRHGSGFAVVGDHVYTASGSGNRGGGPELTTIERFKLPTKVAADGSGGPLVFERWHPIELSFRGPNVSETANPNPFTDHRLDVTFRNGSTQKTIRGFYAADGNAAESSADAGNVWKVRFAADQIGTWTYEATFRSGADVAISDDANAGETLAEFSGAGGRFQVTEPKAAAGNAFTHRGFVHAEGGHYRLSGGGHWLKGGCDSPENLLAFVDFDGTYRMKAEARDGEAAAPEDVHVYVPHRSDWKIGDPTWAGGKGKALIGGVNYLASMGANSMYFLTMNIGGDGKDVWPYASPDDPSRFDCSKLDQWNVLFTHMQEKGIALHVVLQETENEKMLDGGNTGRFRKLYFQELIARFGHHPALIWNLGEENGPADFSPDGQTNDQQKAMATYLRQSDPYQHPVLIHTHSQFDEKHEILTGLLGHAPLDGLSFQVDDPNRVHQEILEWKHLSTQAGQPWMIGMDEIGKWDTGVVPDSVDPSHDGLRKKVLWGALLAGASGVEWYFGAHHPHNDLTCEDWRQRENMWKQTTIARQFFEQHLPYWEMTSADDLTENESDYCFAKAGDVYAIYLPAGETTSLNLEDADKTFMVSWLDPKSGGDLQSGSVSEVTGGGNVSLGDPPDGDAKDWVVLVK